MIRFIFLVLLLANLVVWLIAQGHIDPGANFRPATREPSKLTQQLEADKIIPLNEEQFARLAGLNGQAANKEGAKEEIKEPSADAPASPAKAEPKVDDGRPLPDKTLAEKVEPKETKPGSLPANLVVPVCYEIAGLDETNARKLASALGPLKLGARQQTRKTEDNNQWIVYVPPRPDRAGAEKKAAEIKELGVPETYIISDNSPLRWAVSLGIFSSREAAETQLDKLKEKGVRTAKIGPRNPDAGTSAVTLRKLNPVEWEKVQSALKPLQSVKGLVKREC